MHRVLCFADLHIDYRYKHINEQIDNIQQLVKMYEPDIILIAGDVFEYTIIRSNSTPSVRLQEIFGKEIPVVYCLGNHEFAYNDYDDVIEYYKCYGSGGNIHCLDIQQSYIFEDELKVVGNVLWYDNTLANNPLSKPDVIVNNWLDSTIGNFIPSERCAHCKQQILDSLDDTPTILLTHCVPHKELNMFSLDEPYSRYNQYSGCNDFLSEVVTRGNIKNVICGHTHRYVHRLIDCNDKRIECRNIGNDYYRNNIEGIKVALLVI